MGKRDSAKQPQRYGCSEVAALARVYRPDDMPREVEQAVQIERDEWLHPRPLFEENRNALLIPPANREAEQNVLGAMLLWPECYYRVRTILRAEDFYHRDNMQIFSAIEKMHAADPPESVDSVTVADALHRDGQSDTTGGLEYLAGLAGSTGSAANVEGWAKIITEKARLRRLVQAGVKLQATAFRPEGATSSEIASIAVSEIQGADHQAEKHGASFFDSLRAVAERIKRDFEGGEDQLPGIRFGMPALEELIGGLEPGKVYNIGANTKVGKSILMSNIVENAALLYGKRCAEFHLEMSPQQAGRRRLSSVSGVHHELLRRPRQMEETDWAAMAEGMRRLKEVDITCFHEQYTIEEIAAHCVMLKARGELHLIAVDYLQKIPVAGKHDRRDLEIAHNTWGLKALAKRLDVPVLTASQVNRKNQEGTAIRPPRVSDLRESGSIEQDTDVLILLHRPSAHNPTERGHGVRCEVALNRDGETGIIRLDEDLERVRFLHTDTPWIDITHAEGPKRGSSASSGLDF